MPTVIDADAFRDRIDERRRGERSFTLVDTRPREGYESWRIADSIHYFYKPSQEFDVDDFEAETGLGPDDAIVTVCAKGKSSFAFAEALEAAGYDDVTVVADGMRGWSGVYDRTAVPSVPSSWNAGAGSPGSSMGTC
jgi:thiosulfate/3-mercaptopyruvate sulfurtransferase